MRRLPCDILAGGIRKALNTVVKIYRLLHKGGMDNGFR